ncbi:MAG: choice-of-anchor I family protein, partial [Taibaiella sp.]|nr:choice-of-anchor I family protein [Taibaiella sp.]
AVAVEASPKTDSGSIVILDTNGNLLKQVKAGALPDMITFTPDGKYILTANEGEPNSAYTIDPEGSVTIVDISNGVANATSSHVRFNSFNGSKASLIAQGVRIFGYNNPTVAQDFEPEYIAISKNSDTAYVGLQENNAVAVMDIANKTFVRIMPLGYVDHSQPGKGIDGSDRNPEPLIANWPVRGLYMPDAIASYTVGNNTYVVFTNEGDAREYDPFEEESRISSGSYDLDPAKFPEGDLYKKSYCIGRLAATSTLGDTDNDGDFDEIYVFGTRGFVIKNAATGATAFESGDQFEQITLADPKVGKIFNASNSDNDPRTRSDAKGPEPEAVAIGTIHDTTYAFIGLERIGGVMVYDISNPSAPVFVDYINTRDTAAFGGDNGPEDIKFLHADKTPHGKHYLLVSNEVSATVAVFEVKVGPVSVKNININLGKLNVYPNPVVNSQLYFSTTVSGVMMDINGRVVNTFSKANSINTANLPAGVYMLKAEGFAPEKVVIQ